MDFLKYLLPDQDHLHLDKWDFKRLTLQLTLTVSSTQTIAYCPVCGTSTQRVHSRYERTLRDLPCVNYGMTLFLKVRKFFCINAACKRRIFTERLPEVTVPWSRRTCRLAEQLIAIGIALGGAAGARLSYRLGYGISDSTLLYLLAKLPLPSIVTPKTLGVDDFAFRKRQSYGTILVDLDQRRPIALLRDREAETLAEWLKQYPDIKVLSRDRSTSYKSGMNQGAPDAVQVADRFHLLQNLGEVLEQVFGSFGQALKEVDTAQRYLAVTDGTATEVVVATPPSSTPKVQQLTQQRRGQRFKTYNKVWQLHRQGWSSGAIAQKVGISTRTVQRYLLTTNFPERQARSDLGRSLLNPYKDYLLQQYNQGRRQVKVLFTEIEKQGYKGSYKTVTRYVRQLALAQGVELRQYPKQRRLPKVIDPPSPILTPRRATFLVLRRPENLEGKDEQIIQHLTEQQAELATAINLTQGFAQLVRQRQPQQLDSWLEQAEQSHLPPFVRFAKSLREDYDAVKAGVTMTTSNGPVEGHINRLKMLKRQMYGRAGIDLLQRRFILATLAG